VAYNVVVVGHGLVGRELARLLLGGALGLPLRLTGIASSRGAVILGGPGDLVHLHRIYREGGGLEDHPGFREGLGPVEAAVLANAHVAAVAIPPSYVTGEPNRSIVFGLLEHGVSVVTADKTVPALDYDRLVGEAEARNLYVGLRATVAAGTPAVDAARGLRLREVRRLRAVLNTTTSYIVEQVEEGHSYREALSQARAAGLAEPDPALDTLGLDAAAKLVILSRLLGFHASMDAVEREPLESFSEDAVRAAAARGLKVRMVAEADYARGRYRVYPDALAPGDPLYASDPGEAAIVFEVEDSQVTLRGPAGPAWRTARVMLTDLADYVAHARLVERLSPGE